MKLNLFSEFQLGGDEGNRVVSVGEAVKDMAYRTPQELMEKVIINFTELTPLFQKIFN